MNVTNPRTQAKKGLISYYKTNGIIALKKHVDVDFYLFIKSLKKKIMKKKCGKVANKKNSNPFGLSISIFLL